MAPTLLQLGWLRIPSFGLFIAAAFLAAIWWTEYAAKQQGRDPELMTRLSVWVMISALAGSRVLYVILEWSQYQGRWLKIIVPPYEGFVFYGGLIAAFVTAFLYLRFHHLPVWETGDLLGPALALGQSIGRWGCFFNGCCFGAPCDPALPWGLTFPDGSEPFRLYGQTPVHPSQIYESLGCLLIFLFLWRWSKRPGFAGRIFWTYGILYGLLRFSLEFLRGDDRGFYGLGLSISQWISLGVVLGSVTMFILLRRKSSGLPKEAAS